MKKIMNVLIVFILLGALIPLTFADETDTTSNTVDFNEETQKQIGIMNNGLGAEIRLLQLEKAIIKNLNMGQEIILFLEKSDINTIDLQVILAEFEFVLEEIQKVDPVASDAVSIFVDLKHDAVNISKDFRESVRGLLDGNLHDQIQQQIQNMTCNQTQNISLMIQNKIRQYNSKQFRNMYQHLDVNGSEWIHRYQNTSMTQNQVRQNITMWFNQTEKGNQFSILSSFKEQKIENGIKAQNQVQNASKGFQKRQENRFKKRLQRIRDFPDNPLYNQLVNRMENKLNSVNNGGNGSGGNESNNDGEGNNPGGGQNGPGDGKNGGLNSSGGGH